MIIIHDLKGGVSYLSHHSEKFEKHRFGRTGHLAFFISYIII